MKRGVRLTSHTGNPVISIHMLQMTNLLIKRTRSRLSQLGSKYVNVSWERKVVASLQLSYRNRPRVQNNVNDNYCVKCVTGLKDCVCVPGQRVLNPSPGTAKDQQEQLDQQEQNCKFTCKLLCCKCSFSYRVATKESCKSQLLSQLYRNKIYERCFLCRSLELCKSCHKCPNCCHRSTCRGKATPVLENMENPGGESKGSNSAQRGLLPFRFRLNLTRSQRLQALRDQIQTIMSGPVCLVRQFMSLIGLLTATEK